MSPDQNQKSDRKLLITLAVIIFFAATIYAGWDSRSGKLLNFEPPSVLDRFLKPNAQNSKTDAAVPTKTPLPLNSYANQDAGLAFSYPASLELDSVDGTAPADNRLRIFFRSQEKIEPKVEDQPRKIGQGLFRVFLSFLPGFPNYLNQDLRPPAYSLTFYLKSKSSAEDLFSTTSRIREEFCREGSFTLSDLKLDQRNGFKISCSEESIYLLDHPYQPRRFLVLAARLSSLTPPEAKSEKLTELEEAAQTILTTLSFLESVEGWTKYENGAFGYTYRYPSRWENEATCFREPFVQPEASPAAEATVAAETTEPICIPNGSRLRPPLGFSQNDQISFQVTVTALNCPARNPDQKNVFLDGYSTAVEETNREKTFNLNVNNRCFRLDLKSPPNSPLRSILDQILSTLRFSGF